MYKFILFTFLLLQLLTAQVFKSSFDSGSPSSTWPDPNGSSYEGWTPLNYFESGTYFDGSELSTTIYHSAPRSLKVTRKAGYWGVTDISHSLSTQSQALYVDYWVYFLRQGWASNPGYCIPYADGGLNVHFLFLESARSFSSGKIDFVEYTNKRYSGQPKCWDPTAGGAQMAMTSNDYNGNGDEEWYGSTGKEPGACWQVKNNTDKWVHITHGWDLSKDSCWTWINGILTIASPYQNYTGSFSDGIGTLIISGWVSQQAQNGFDATFYIDDVAMNPTNIFIGSTPPPVEPPPIEPPENPTIALRLLWTGSNPNGTVKNYQVYEWQGEDTTSISLTLLVLVPSHASTSYEIAISVKSSNFKYGVKAIGTSSESNIVQTKIYKYVEYEEPTPPPVENVPDPQNVRVVK